MYMRSSSALLGINLDEAREVHEPTLIISAARLPCINVEFVASDACANDIDEAPESDAAGKNIFRGFTPAPAPAAVAI